MSVELVSETDLRAALRPHQVDAAEFKAGIRDRIEAGVVPLQDVSQKSADPVLTVAATFIPWPLITGGKFAGGGVKLSSLTLAQKLLGYAALPAISLFLLVGATFFSTRKIHKVQQENQSDISDAREMQAAVRQWWRSHRFAAIMVGLLLYFLTSFARIGVGNRYLVGHCCFMGLGLLSMVMQNPFIGQSEIHFVDQKLIAAVFLMGTLILLPFPILSMARLGGREAFQSKQKTPHWLLVFVTFLIPTGLFYIALQPFRKSTGNQPAIFGGYGWLIFAVMIAVQISAVLWAYVRRSRKGGATR